MYKSVLAFAFHSLTRALPITTAFLLRSLSYQPTALTFLSSGEPYVDFGVAHGLDPDGRLDGAGPDGLSAALPEQAGHGGLVRETEPARVLTGTGTRDMAQTTYIVITGAVTL